MQEEAKKNWSWLALGCSISLVLFVIAIGVSIFLVNMRTEKTTETNKIELSKEVEGETFDEFMENADENTIAYTIGEFGKEYTPWWSVGDGFIKQYDKEGVAKKKKELIDELKKKHPNITDEEAELLIGDINIWGWKSVQIDDNGVMKYGSKYFTNAKALKEEFIKRTGTDAFTLIPKDSDGFVIPMNEEDYGYDLITTNETVDKKLAHSGDKDIKVLEDEVKQHWGEIYTPKPLKDLQSEDNTQRDVYFYQATNNLNNVINNIINLASEQITEKEKEQLKNVKFTFAKHWNIYRAYMVNMPSTTAQKLGISTFDMLFYYTDDKDNQATMKQRAIYGAFGNKALVKEFSKTNPNDNNYNTEKTFEFSYDDPEADEATKLADFSIKKRTATYPTQQANNITAHVLPDGHMKFGDDELRCYAIWLDDETLQAKFAEGRHCLVYKDKKLVGMVQESDTAVKNTTFKDNEKLIKKTGYTEANKPTLTEEQKAQNAKVDELYNKYYADEIKEREKTNKEALLDTAKSFGYTTIEAYEKAKKENIESIKNSIYEYNEDYDHWKYFSIESTVDQRFTPTVAKDTL